MPALPRSGEAAPRAELDFRRVCVGRAPSTVPTLAKIPPVMSSAPATVLIADDHPVVRAGVGAMLSGAADLHVACECADGAEAVRQWRALRPAAGLIDLRMPGMDGVEAIRAIREVDPGARLAVMTTVCGDEDVFRALQAGACGYVLKDCGADALVDCLRAVLRGQRYLDPAAAASLAARVVHAPLTARERDVLDGLAQGLSNKRIARELAVTEGTVKTHVKSLLDKLDADNRTQAVRVAAARGLIPPTAAVR